MNTNNLDSLELEIKKYAQQIPERIQQYLQHERGLSPEVIKKYEIGWDGENITIPIRNINGEYVYCKRRKDPKNNDSSPKYLFPKGVEAELFGRESIINNHFKYIVITEGEFDCLSLISRKIPAISSTAGAATFREKWINEIKSTPIIYICFDTDEAGKRGAEKLAQIIPNARIVTLPDMGEGRKDITDYFVKYNKTADDFRKLLAETKASDTPQDDTDDIDNEYVIVDGLRKVRLALDFLDDFAIVTLPFPTKLKSDLKNNITDRYWIITSKGRKYPLEEFYLSKLGLYPASKCFIMDNRWNYQHIIKWLKGKVKSNPKLLFQKIIEALEKYLDYKDKRLFKAITLWIIGTYVFPLFDSYPILIIVGVSGSGKSKLIKIINFTAFNSFNLANVSDASIFRIVESSQATLLLDENELINDPQKIGQLSLILAATGKQGQVARIAKQKDGDFIPQLFNLYGPKVIANIAGINSEALINRSIFIHTTPTQISDIANVYPEHCDLQWQGIRNEAYLFCMEHWMHIRKLISKVTARDFKLTGYDFMIWLPMLVLGKYLESYAELPILEDIINLAKEKTEERKDERIFDRNYVLLTAIRRMVLEKIGLSKVDENLAEFYPTNAIREVYAVEMELEIDSDAYKKLSLETIGKQVRKLNVGKMGLERVEQGNKPLRGVWINLDSFNETLQRFGMEPIMSESRSKGIKNTADVWSNLLDLKNLEI